MKVLHYLWSDALLTTTFLVNSLPSSTLVVQFHYIGFLLKPTSFLSLFEYLAALHLCMTILTLSLSQHLAPLKVSSLATLTHIRDIKSIFLTLVRISCLQMSPSMRMSTIFLLFLLLFLLWCPPHHLFVFLLHQQTHLL